jgi:DNA-directed RNA polymerase specialized sigma24 family protein
MERTKSVSGGWNNAGMVSDMELVLRVQQGDKRIFAELVHRHQRRVYWIIQGMLQNQSDAEEIVQEAFFKALKHIGDFRGEAQFSTWLIQIAINEARVRRGGLAAQSGTGVGSKGTGRSDTQGRPFTAPQVPGGCFAAGRSAAFQ